MEWSLDLLSVSVGFLAGAVTGAAAGYLASYFTDQRRSADASKNRDRHWAGFAERHADFVDELRSDLSGDFGGCRYFFLKTKRSIVNASEPSFEYHTDVLPNLNAAVKELEEYGYVVDETTGNVPRYRIRENFVALVLGQR